MNYLGTQLRALRESQGLLLRQVAAQMDVDTALMSKLERGERSTQRAHIHRMATVLNTKQDEPMAEKAWKLIRNKKNQYANTPLDRKG